MTRDQEVFLSMALKVKNFTAKNVTVFTPIPGVTPLLAQLDTNIANLITADTSSRSDLTGYAMTKSNKRVMVENDCLKFSNALAALAVNNGDLVLQKKADFPTSFWNRITEDELVTNATILKNLATPIIATLATYNITAADLTAFATAITNFTDGISDPTLAIDQRKIDNKRIPEIIDQIRILFDTKLDVLVRVLETSNPSMYELYTSARALDQRGSIAKPIAEIDVMPRTTVTAHKATDYSSDTFYTIQNLGKEAVYFSLSSIPDTEGPDPVLLSNGETRSRLAENLAPSGTFLVIKNTSEVTIKVRVWVE